MHMSDFTNCRYGAADEGQHNWANIENFNESVYFNFLDSRSKVGGILRVANRPSLGYKEFSVNIKLPGGGIAFRAGRLPTTTNSEFSAGGLTFSLNEPTRSWKLSFRGSLSLVSEPARLANEPGRILKSSPAEDCEIDLTWNAGSPMFVLNADGSGKPTPGETSMMGTDHYEQFGTVTGKVALGAQSWALSGVPSMRDHTWGPRMWGSFMGEWMCAFLPGGTGMTLYSELQSTGKRVYSGAVMFEGEAHFVRAYDVYTHFDEVIDHGGRHRSVLKADGLPIIPLDGAINHFSPLVMATGEHRTRLTSMTVEFVGGFGGGAFAEFLRPLPPKPSAESAAAKL
jgi:hypothetical protein